MTVHVRWPGETGGAFGFALIFLVLFASRQKEQKNCIKTKKVMEASVVTFLFYALSFACAKESAKEKHTGNDIQPLPDTVI